MLFKKQTNNNDKASEWPEVLIKINTDCWIQTMKYFIFFSDPFHSSKLKIFKSRHPKKSWPVYFSKYKTVTKRNGFSGSCVRRLTLVFHTGEPKIMTNGASCWALQERDTIHGCSRQKKKKKFPVFKTV